MKIKVFEAFAGIGTQNMALKRLKKDFGLDYEIVGVSEVDEYAILSYDAIHSKNKTTFNKSDDYMKNYFEKINAPLLKDGRRKNLGGKGLKRLFDANKRINNYGDISKIDVKDLPKFNLFTYSFPCQSISVAGKMNGLREDSGTRSSLLWQCKRIIDYKKPKYLLMENVKNLVSKKFINDFKKWIKYLESIGYKNYWQVLNASDYQIPQQRERECLWLVFYQMKNILFLNLLS